MTRIWGYGEDALTLWGLNNHLEKIVVGAGSNLDPKHPCEVFYRPSFGRRGGSKRSEFGEFDFIILAPKTIILGESKWEGSNERKGDMIKLRKEQTLRHKIMRCYLECLPHEPWSDYKQRVKNRLVLEDIDKNVPDEDKLLANVLKTIFKRVTGYYGLERPQIVNILVYFTCKPNLNLLIDTNGNTEVFSLIQIPYPANKDEIFIQM